MLLKKKFTNIDILNFQREEELRKQRCKAEKHYFISKDGDVYCKWCGFVKGPAYRSGLKPLTKGRYEESGRVWGKG